MQMRQLGKNGLKVSAIGFGCMGISAAYGSVDESEALATIHRALDLGVNFLDTADIYGVGHNEKFVGSAIQGKRNQIVLATKVGFVVAENDQRYIDGSPKHIREACDASLMRLGLDFIDLYYLHRIDQHVPVEESVGAMSELVTQGKVRFLGLSEVSPLTLRRAHSVHRITAVQSEYSLWTRDVEAEVLPVCHELGIGFVAFSPLGRGFLTGKIHNQNDFEESDMRRDL
ncbi:aldo/keto reductase, partial [bacterium]|nr:aldo/keto reductase [bacterium]